MAVPAAAATAEWRVGFRGGADVMVNDLASVGPKNAWAAGARRTKEFDPRTGSYFTAPQIRHWNGGRWTVVRNPVGPKGFPLREISLIEASGPSNVWTAGTAVAKGTGDVASSTRSVVSRWNGKRWQLMGSGRTTVTDLDVLGPGHAWIVGRDDRKAFFKHFRNGRWTSLPAPGGLREVSVRTPNDIWGLGRSSVLHFNGKAWRTVALPKIALPVAPDRRYGPVRPRLDAVQVTAGNVWIAVGFQQGDWSQPGTVLLRRAKGKWHHNRLPKDVVSTLSGDGKGGIWAASYRQSITATPDAPDPYAYTTLSIDTLRHTGAKLARRNLTPVASGFQWGDLVAVPKTDSALAAGFNWRPPQGSVILRYGR
ncbi:hypothetical protein SMC26_18500 [Actinomadura fulvescens]|uniref:Uncharacterized protein n=1 Tax=Actinomadura fulvescens TaxID=46160 RepID=A0ABN3QF55_9ACTN